MFMCVGQGFVSPDFGQLLWHIHIYIYICIYIYIYILYTLYRYHFSIDMIYSPVGRTAKKNTNWSPSARRSRS